MQLLRENGGLHRAELARRAGLSRSAVTAITAELIAEGLIVEVSSVLGKDGGAPGRRTGRAGEVLTLNASAGAALGIDYSVGDVPSRRDPVLPGGRRTRRTSRAAGPARALCADTLRQAGGAG